MRRLLAEAWVLFVAGCLASAFLIFLGTLIHDAAGGDKSARTILAAVTTGFAVLLTAYCIFYLGWGR